MKTPEQLPYLAARTGVSFERAVELWRESLQRATVITGWVGGSEYWGCAEALLIEALEAERQRSPLPQVLPLIRAQHQWARLPLVALEGLSRAWLDRSRAA